MWQWILAQLMAILSFFSPPAAVSTGSTVAAQDVSGYVLSMSWSPTFCLENSQALQCDPQADHGLILHGLWPQHDVGYPSYCPAQQEELTHTQVDKVLDITPSRGLVRHEWRKHGTCSGLSVEGYFKSARKAFEGFNAPRFLNATGTEFTAKTLRQAIQRANPHLPDNSFQIVCKGKFLKEIRICLDKNMEAESCGTKHRTCNGALIIAPAAP